MAYFNAKHDNGTSWKLGVPSKGRPEAEVIARAALFVRNYCLKNGISGEVQITAEDNSHSFRMTDHVAALAAPIFNR